MADKSKTTGWYGKAAEHMVRENKTLIQVALEMGLDIHSRDLVNIERHKAFQQALWAEKNKFYKEIASDPDRGKNVLLGQMTLIVDQLMKEGKWEKAAAAILQLAKIEGIVGTEGTVNVFGPLSERQLAVIEGKLKNIDSGTTSDSGTPAKVQ
jgi:hypothetical protein